jgi:GR25 family glycosyltransferase involved in LPS biosynthesis
MLNSFLEDEGTALLTLEDDVQFKNYDHLEDALWQLPANWDVLYLGANLRGQRPDYYSKNLKRIHIAYTTHAIAYSRKMVEYIVNSYNPYNFEMYDSWLSDNVLGKYNCYVVSPMVAYQRPIYSDLWGVHADYTSCFDDGNKLLTA